MSIRWVLFPAGLLAACAGTATDDSANRPEVPQSFGPAALVWSVAEGCDSGACARTRTYVWSDEGGARLLVPEAFSDVSPDGAYIMNDRGDAGMRIVPIVDGDECSLDAMDGTAGFSADGSKFVGETGGFTLVVVDSETCQVVARSDDVAAEVDSNRLGTPVSPDGSWLAFIERRAEYDFYGSIDPHSTPDVLYLVDLAHGDTREVPLANGGGAVAVGLLAGWSADSMRIAFAGPGTVAVVDRAGRISSFESATGTPRWSPTSAELARIDRDGQLVIFDASSSATRAFAPPGPLASVVSGWSPDGTQLVVDHARGTSVIAASDGVHIADFDVTIDLGPDGWAVLAGEALVHLSNPDIPTLTFEDSRYAWVDGERIGYVSEGAVHVASFDGSRDTVLWTVDSDGGSTADADIWLVGTHPSSAP